MEAYKHVLDAILQSTPRRNDITRTYATEAYVVVDEKTDEHNIVALGECWESRQIDAGVVEIWKAMPYTTYFSRLFNQRMDLVPEPIDLKNWIICDNKDETYKEVTDLLKIFIPMVSAKIRPDTHRKIRSATGEQAWVWSGPNRIMMTKPKSNPNGLADNQIILVPRALEEVYSQRGYKRPIPFKPHLESWNIQLVGQLADQAQRCLTLVESQLEKRRSYTNEVTEALKEVKDMLGTIHSKVGIVHTHAISDTPVRPKPFKKAISNGEYPVQGNKGNRQLLPLAVRTDKGTYTLAFKDDAVQTEDGTEVDRARYGANKAEASTGTESLAQADNELPKENKAVNRNKAANKNMPPWNIALPTTHTLSVKIPRVCSRCLNPYSSKEVFDMHECFSNPTFGKQVSGFSDENKMPIVMNFCMVCENLYNTIGCEKCCKTLSEVWRQEDIKNFIEQANAVRCPLKWCGMEFKDQQKYEHHLPCNPPTARNKRKATPNGKPTEKRPRGRKGTVSWGDMSAGNGRNKQNNDPPTANKPGRHSCVGTNRKQK